MHSGYQGLWYGSTELFQSGTELLGQPCKSCSKSMGYKIVAENVSPWLLIHYSFHNFADDWMQGIDLIFFCFLPFLKSESSEQSGSVMVPLPPGEKESWGAISGTVVLVILVVLLLALLLLYRHRQRDKQNNTSTVSFSASRTVNSEYAIPGKVKMGFLSHHKAFSKDAALKVMWFTLWIFLTVINWSN